MKNIIYVPLFLVLVLASCNSSTPTKVKQNDYLNIDVAALKTMMEDRRETFLLINTHIPFAGNIPDTDLSIPYNEILDNLAQLPADKTAEIVLYCRSDSMSHSAAADLASAGYTNVMNLLGGFNAWKKAGLPMDMSPQD